MLTVITDPLVYIANEFRQLGTHKTLTVWRFGFFVPIASGLHLLTVTSDALLDHL
jgi:hypothetical protein